MEKYIGTKIIEAEAMEKDSKDGYKVIYSNPNNTTYESWSPKAVFEEAYVKLEEDKKKTRELLCDLFFEANKKNKIFVSQAYVWDFLDLCEKKGVTFNKTLNKED